MQAVWLENNQISMRDVPQPKKENEALIQITKAGICSTRDKRERTKDIDVFMFFFLLGGKSPVTPPLFPALLAGAGQMPVLTPANTAAVHGQDRVLDLLEALFGLCLRGKSALARADRNRLAAGGNGLCHYDLAPSFNHAIYLTLVHLFLASVSIGGLVRGQVYFDLFKFQPSPQTSQGQSLYELSHTVLHVLQSSSLRLLGSNSVASRR
jgi:hypothetical protein